MVGKSHNTNAQEDDIVRRPKLSSDPILDADGICGMDEDYSPQTHASTIVCEEVHDRVHDFDDAGGAPTISHK